ncbi:MAG: hypothetical protein IT449_06395 [Phycisphaerales bacterium]|nr:hypothetical protein [Phycisphaerales bacterium]
MKFNRHRMWRLGLWTVTVLPAILPVSCAQPLLQQLTPFLIDGSNSALRDLLFLAAPFVLP